MLSIQTSVVSDYFQNARLLTCLETGDVALIDPGFESEKILALFDLRALKKIILTHAHIDHAAEVEYILKQVKQQTGLEVPLLAHKAEAMFRKALTMQAEMMGIKSDRILALREPDIYLEDDQEVKIGHTSLKALCTPGHSPGHLSLFFPSGVSEIKDLEYQEKKNTKPVLIAGDALFRGSIGRTDLPGSVHKDLIRSIKERLLVLPDETLVLSGHGPHTTIGFEKLHNPFLQGD